MPHHTLIETTLHGEQTRTWFCPLCHFTCASAPSLATPSLTDLRRHFLLSLLTIAQEAQSLNMPKTAQGIMEVIDRAAEEMDEMEEAHGGPVCTPHAEARER